MFCRLKFACIKMSYLNGNKWNLNGEIQNGEREKIKEWLSDSKDSKFDNSEKYEEKNCIKLFWKLNPDTMTSWIQKIKMFWKKHFNDKNQHFCCAEKTDVIWTLIMIFII